MNKSTIVGALLGALLVFGMIEMGAVAARPIPPAEQPVFGRFQAILLHPSAATSWTGILDTQTGCVWAYATASVSANDATPEGLFKAERGANFLTTVAYDPGDFLSLQLGTDHKIDYTPEFMAIGEEAKACSNIRRRALGLQAETSK